MASLRCSMPDQVIGLMFCVLGGMLLCTVDWDSRVLPPCWNWKLQLEYQCALRSRNPDLDPNK